MPQSDDPASVVKAYVDALGSGDTAALNRLWAPDSLIAEIYGCSPGIADRVRKGRDIVLARKAQKARKYRAHRYKHANALDSGTTEKCPGHAYSYALFKVAYARDRNDGSTSDEDDGLALVKTTGGWYIVGFDVE